MMLERVNSPADLKMLTRREVDELAIEIRALLVETCAANGGHLAPNLGVVELTLALHRVLDVPNDAIVWDVGHQAYVHKILTGRRDRFATLRTEGGISGFTNRAESASDAFGAGHASTSVSAALGMVLARDLRGGKETIVAVLGDGALTGGLAYEALNNAGSLASNFIVILNDNAMSIAPNVGFIASYLGRLRSKPLYTRARARAKDVLSALPFGETAMKALSTAEVAAMRFVSPDEKATVIFEEMGFRYIGPVDGHDYDAMVDVISNARRIDGPVLLHVRTTKGKGYEPAESDARRFHGCGAFATDDGTVLAKQASVPTFSDAFAQSLIRAAERDRRVIAFTAAMPDGTKLSSFAARFPDRAFDVGIAEAHAVCCAAGAAAVGMRPVCVIYSTFLQRAYDQVIHDVAIQKLPVIFCLDRAGFVGDDGPTHMGLYDIPSLRTLPGMTILAPRSEVELGMMLDFALTLEGPSAIRYPRGASAGTIPHAPTPIAHGRSEVLQCGHGIAILALGTACEIGYSAAQGHDVTVVNARFASPIDRALLDDLASDHHTIITLEEGSLAGGYGSAVLEAISDAGLAFRVERIGVGEEFIAAAQPSAQRAHIGLTPEYIRERLHALQGQPAVSGGGSLRSM